jgi:hypothetical protein
MIGKEAEKRTETQLRHEESHTKFGIKPYASQGEASA